MKIAIIGAGNMGGALARGLARGTKVTVENIWLRMITWRLLKMNFLQLI